MLLTSEDEVFQNFVKKAKRVQREKKDKIVSLRNNHSENLRIDY